MRRALMTTLLLLAWPAAAEAATVKVVDCVPALAPAERSATFETRMRATGATERMQVRFTLQVREQGVDARWRRVLAPGFDAWLTSDPGVRRYVYDREIRNLTAPASYRTVVRFRWLDADGDVLRSSRGTSAPCRQPDMRPDLAPITLSVLPGRDGAYDYHLMVRNAGPGHAGRFDVALSAGDAALAPLSVPELAARDRRILRFTGPACEPGAPITATVDAGATVDERDEDDNVLVLACP